MRLPLPLYGPLLITRPISFSACRASSYGQEGTASTDSSYYFDTGYALFAKRPSRPFPPPFVSPPSGSFSDPLSTHDRSRDQRPLVNGEIIRGITNGDDAVLIGDRFIGANDGVGAWSARPKGHAALWSRLILHFWALEAEKNAAKEPDPVGYLQRAFEQTKEATAAPEWHGTTTAAAALLDGREPVLYVTSLGDSQIMVIRNEEILFKTTEQWHWFDCPRQLGTNSPDTPRENAVLDKIHIQEEDVVLAMSDGVIDNLWEHEIVESVVKSFKARPSMQFVADELVKAARVIAEDPFAESPFMERAVEEGLAMEGGKLDDISVVAAICRRRRGVDVVP